MPDAPASRRDQTASAPTPRGVTRPTPVITTRRCFGRGGASANPSADEDAVEVETPRDERARSWADASAVIRDRDASANRATTEDAA